MVQQEFRPTIVFLPFCRCCNSLYIDAYSERDSALRGICDKGTERRLYLVIGLDLQGCNNDLVPDTRAVELQAAIIQSVFRQLDYCEKERDCPRN